MKIQDLEKRPACEFERDEIVVRLRDLPQQQDAKTGPPDSFRQVNIYGRGDRYLGIGGTFKTDEGIRWADSFGNEINVAFWSEILHW